MIDPTPLQLQHLNRAGGSFPTWQPAMPDPAGACACAAAMAPFPNQIPPVFATAFSNRPAWKNKARRFYPNNSNHHSKARGRFAPFAPRNTTSYLIRAKRSGGLAPLVSPCAATPAVLQTPRISPSTERLVEMAKEAWGVDGYGSMKGLIRLRSEKDHFELAEYEEDGPASGDSSGQSDIEEHVEVEKRLDQDLSRFEMVMPARCEHERKEEAGGYLDRLAEENMTLKERLFLVESHMGELRRRLLAVEAMCRARDGVASQMDGCGDVDGDGNGEESSCDEMESKSTIP